jgi:hypothetical protein
MSLYSLPKEILVQIIEKMERPVYILKVRTRGSNKHDACYKFIGPFYNEDEIGKYFEKDQSFILNHFKKHKRHSDAHYVYELDKLTL